MKIINMVNAKGQLIYDYDNEKEVVWNYGTKTNDWYVITATKTSNPKEPVWTIELMHDDSEAKRFWAEEVNITLKNFLVMHNISGLVSNQ